MTLSEALEFIIPKPQSLVSELRALQAIAKTTDWSRFSAKVIARQASEEQADAKDARDDEP